MGRLTVADIYFLHIVCVWHLLRTSHILLYYILITTLWSRYHDEPNFTDKCLLKPLNDAPEVTEVGYELRLVNSGACAFNHYFTSSHEIVIWISQCFLTLGFGLALCGALSM